MEPKGGINVYTCRKCGDQTITVNLDAGVTPMAMNCRAKPVYASCEGTAYSAGYQVPQDLIPTHGWYSPDETERKRLRPLTLDHVEQGGLLIRALDNLERERFGARFRSDGS